jgi:hypothetical protein
MGDVCASEKQICLPGLDAFFTNWLHQSIIIYNWMVKRIFLFGKWNGSLVECLFFPSGLCPFLSVRWALSLAHTRGRGRGRAHMPSSHNQFLIQFGTKDLTHHQHGLLAVVVVANKRPHQSQGTFYLSFFWAEKTSRLKAKATHMGQLWTTTTIYYYFHGFLVVPSSSSSSSYSSSTAQLAPLLTSDIQYLLHTTGLQLCLT